MSDSQPPRSWDNFMAAGKRTNIFGQPEEETGYRAFKPCSPGDVLSVELVPADATRPGYEISYFQSWTVRFLGDTMLAILCPSSQLVVFIEGRKLGELRARLRERRIAAIYEHNQATHGPVADDAASVTTIRVELSNDSEAVHRWSKP